MLPAKIALVARTFDMPYDEVARVATALTMQVSRDLTPAWGIHATVRPFPNPHDVPAGYWPIFVVDNLPPDEGGFHWTRHKQPYAMVEAGDTWSLSASHELIEMLVDPSGNRLVAGPELVVRADGAIAENHHNQVEYLVEACDPCESASCAYLVEDVVVSDFFTPHYHDAAAAPGVRYSFTGALTRPRDVLAGGYISWFDPRTQALRQLQWFQGEPRVVTLEQQTLTAGESLRQVAHQAKHEAPRLSRVNATQPLLQLRTTKREAIRQTAAKRAAAYE